MNKKVSLISIMLLALTATVSCNFGNNTHEHKDENNDHYCDVCDIKLSEHNDENPFDHLCDLCGEKISTCIDLDEDELCDICGSAMCQHVDANKNHYCDICKEKISDHTDTNQDGYCEYCEHYSGSKFEADVPTKLNGRAGYEFTKNVTKPTSGTTTIDIYSFNDFHGQVNSTSSSYLGLGKLGTFVKDKTSKQNTLVIDSGDTYQGSLESNYNSGNLINDVMSYAKLSARTIGNHDFDWGSQKLAVNTARTYADYNIPVLGANIYNFDWNSKTIGDTQMYNLGREYVTYVLDNGVKVGIVGVIGSNQITSISTNNVKNLTFTNHINKIKDVSDYLRTQLNCDIVISSEHNAASYDDSELTEISPVSGKRYVDYGVCGHSHSIQENKYNDVYFTQARSNGSNIYKATLTFNYSTKAVTTSGVEYYSAYEISANYPTVDSGIQNIINNYAEETNIVGSKVLSTKMSGYFSSTEELMNLMSEAIYYEATKEGYDIDFAISNNARASLSATLNQGVTYSKLFTCFPFDNTVYIVKVKGNQSANEIVYPSNALYNVKGKTSINSYTTYTLAILDYLAFHTNTYRNYDYFPNLQEIGYLKKSDGTIYTYREVLADYLINGNKVFNASDYTDSEERFSKPDF